MKLAGLRVLDLSQFLPGPMLTRMLADHGAEVIKIEPPGEGEPVRHVGLRQGRHTVWFRNTHRGKKSVVLNLKDPAQRDALLAACAEADVFVEAFRPGVADRLGLGYAQVAARNPGIVYCSLSAYGQSGPLRDRPAHDLAIQAQSGAVSVNLGRDGHPVNPNMPVADLAASLLGLSGVLMALLRRERTGLGDYLDIAMQDALMSWMPNVVGPVFAEQRAPVPGHERSWGGNAFYRIYATADGRHLVLGGSEMKFVERLCRAIGREDLIPLAARGPGPHQAPLVEALTELFRSKPLADWPAFLDPLDLCWAPVLDLHEAWNQPQVLARGMRLCDAEGADQLGVPIRFAREPAAPNLDTPELGRDTAEFLRRYGGAGVGVER